MAATTSLSRIVLCNTATVSLSYIWCLRSERHRRDRPGAGNPPPLSSEFPASGQPPLAPRSYESRDGNPPTFFLRKVLRVTSTSGRHDRGGPPAGGSPRPARSLRTRERPSSAPARRASP